MAKRQASTSPHTAKKRKVITTSSTSSKSANSSTSSQESAGLPSPDFSLEALPESGRLSDSHSSSMSTASEEGKASSPIKDPASPRTSGTLSMGKEITKKVVSIPKHINGDSETGLLSPTTREPSHDGTVVLPMLPRKFPHFPTNALIPFQPADSFPIYKNGDVIIKTELGPSTRTFQLHSVVLSRHSPWFAHGFQCSFSEDPPPTWYSFTIEEANGKVGLVRQRAEGERPTLPYGDQSRVVDGVAVKVEDTSDEVDIVPSLASTDMKVVHETSLNIVATLRCYTEIFGTFYSIPPQVSSTDIGNALVQSESLTKIAAELGCLHLLRSYIGNALSQHRQALFLAIKSDPARWIQLAFLLQNQSIYTECLVHLIGAHPRWNPAWATKRTALPEELRNLIKRKSQELDRTRTELERDLLLTSLPYGRRGTPLDPTDRGQTETWLTVQVFRDQLAQHIEELDRRNDTLSRGTLFRSLRKGTLPCLETEHVRTICQGTMHSDWRDLGDDLKRLKDYAGRLVEKLAANELMIDPDANNVGYLTCVKVKNEDVPWLASSQNSA